MKVWWSISQGNLCFAVITEANRVIDVAPVGKWMLGLTWSAARTYLERRGAKIERLKDE